jgi:hypothetical protein
MNTLFLFIGLIAGLTIINLKRLNKAKGKHKEAFTFKKFASDNLISTLIVFIIGSVLILDPTGMGLVNKIIPLSLDLKMSTFYMMVFGISGDVVAAALLEMGNPKKKTQIGLNK